MRNAIRNEIDYLSACDPEALKMPGLVEEMRQRLDALRRFDQRFSYRDSRPHRGARRRATARNRLS